MRVLDIDLDIFVTPINHLNSSLRLSDEEYELTPQPIIDQFLIEQCGLNTTAPTPGAVLEEHDELFDVLKDLINSKKVCVPFELVHVDAHADLGMGQWSPFEYLLTDLMHKPAQERTDPLRGDLGLNRGTITLFIAACEWLSKLHYVHHPDDGEDFRELLLHWDVKKEQLSLQIPKCSQDEMNRIKSSGMLTERWDRLSKCCTTGRLIPFELSTLDSYAVPEKFDFVFLTRSPGFTPPKADKVFERIRSFIMPIGDRA